MRHRVLIKNGCVSTLYEDSLAPQLHKALGGEAKITRASHVEAPIGPLNEISFDIDLSPSGGPKIPGFPTYKEAVDAEIQWIQENKLNSNSTQTKENK